MNVIAFHIPQDSAPLKTERIEPIASKPHNKHAVFTLRGPLSNDIREVPAGEPIDWEEIYRYL